MSSIEYFKESFDQLQSSGKDSSLHAIRKKAFDTFNKQDIPTSRHEEWKYTRIGSLFNKEYQFSIDKAPGKLSAGVLNTLRLPGHTEANELFFINGIFSLEFSNVLSPGLVVLPLEEAAGNEYKDFVAAQLGHSANYIKDGIHALNTAFVHGGVFIYIEKNRIVDHPIYVYNISDAGSDNILSQPRSLVHVGENAQVQIVETYATIGAGESLTNQVMEIVVEEAARLEYYKIQNDAEHCNQVSTTHIRQVGKSFTYAVTISLNGNIIRNNLNVVLEAEHCEAHMYGLYFLNGKTHVDNHTVVDNVTPHCYSNELYKGIVDDTATGVFNGKIFVRQPAQKTNAYQSNKNILLSESAVVYAKPQLEIFADDVKCSHGCTVGRLDDEGLFYLQSRGISKKMARSLLLYSYAVDILDKIKPEPIRNYIKGLISKRLEFVAE